MKITTAAMRYLGFNVFILLAMVISPSIILSNGQNNHVQIELLNQAERQWLSEHDGLIRIGITEIPPQILHGKKTGEFKGLSIDYIHLLERNLNCKFTLVYYKTWNDVIQKAKSKEIDMIFAAQKTPGRSAYLLFSKPYIELPNVIITRKKSTGSLTLDKMTGLKIACSKGSAVHEYLRAQYDYLDIHPVEDEMSGLLKVSIGEVDAMVVEIARASYYIEKLQITNLHIAGNAGYKYELRFASRKDWPELNRILDKGLLSITERDRAAIIRKWVAISDESFFASKPFWITFITGLAVVLVVFLGAISWNKTLKHQVAERTRDLHQELLERKRAEEALRESEEKYRNLFHNSEVGTLRSKRDGSEVLDLNQKFLDIVGKTKEETIGKPSVLFWADPQERVEMLRRLDAEGRLSAFECNVLNKRKGVRNCLASLVLYREQNIVEGSLIDITERKQAENALRERNAWINTILEASPVAIYSLDRAGIVLSWNKGAEQMFGWRKEETIGKLLPFVPEKMLDEFRTIRNMILHGETFIGVELRRQKKDGSPIDISLSAAPVYDPSGAVTGQISVVLDITKQKKLEADHAALENQLRQAQKMEAVGQLGGGVAHDFNNILSAIVGYSHLSLMKMNADDPNRHNIEQILASSERAAALTQTLLAFSRKQTVRLERVNLNDIIVEFEKFLIRILREDIELKTKVAPRELPVMADRGQIEQVLMNFVTNSRDAMPQGGRIIIETGLLKMDQSFIEAHGFGQEGEYVFFSVTDTGIGITEKNQDKIFEPFFTTKEAGKGTGLGLSMVYGIVKKHEGYIAVNSQTETGTTFTVYLPVARVAAEPGAQKADEQDSVRGGAETVLLAEDDTSLRELTAALLRHYGYTVIEAVDGLDAVAKFTKNRDSIRLVILDGIMPKMNGKVAWQEIKALSTGVKAIFISGYAEDIFTKDGIPDRGASFIQKPYPPLILAKQVRELLDE